jgi:hypothetical protein
MTDSDMEGPTTEEIVRGFFCDIEGIYVQITDDGDLTDEQKARLFQMFEDVEGYLDDVKDIFGDLPEDD